MKSIRYVLPGFLNYSTNETLIKIYEKYPHIAKEDSMIYSFFGTFPKALWNGGRVNFEYENYSIREMKKIRDFYNKKGIKITFTFTNCLINYEHLNDDYCNLILKIFHNNNNEVLVVSPILEEYIRKNYPNYKINRSITFADEKKPYDTKKYHLSVIDKHLNREFEHLSKIKDKDKIELLCDEVCFNDCKYTKQHYTEISETQLGNNTNSKNELYGKCRYGFRVNLYNFLKYRNENSLFYISPSDIYDKYLPLGFEYYKLSGREKYSNSGLLSIISYLIKPKYQEDVLVFLFESMLMEAGKYFMRYYEN